MATPKKHRLETFKDQEGFDEELGGIVSDALDEHTAEEIKKNIESIRAIIDPKLHVIADGIAPNNEGDDEEINPQGEDDD